MGICTSTPTPQAGAGGNVVEAKSSGEITPDPVIGERLRSIPLLAHLSAKDRAIMGGALTERKFKQGSEIIKQGEIGQDFFLIQTGTCEIWRSDEGTNNKLAELSAGDYFGESALLTNDPRSATVLCTTEVSCLTLDQAHFKKMFGKDKLRVHKRVAVSAESNRGNDHKDHASTAPADANREKSPAVRAQLAAACEGNALFEMLQPEQRSKIIDEMWLIKIKVGDNIIVQGELGAQFYVVQTGAFDIVVGKEKVAECGPGQCFGELSILYNQPRAATVTATSESQVWAFDRYFFKQIRTEYAEAKAKEYSKILSKALPGLLSSERAKIANALEEVSYARDKKVFSQGDTGDAFFIVRTGEVVVTQTNPEGETKELVRYGPGQYFGERSLIKNEKRAATITTSQDSNLVYMTQKDFTLILGPMQSVFADRLSSYDESGLGGSAGGERREEEKQVDTEEISNEMDMTIKFDDLTVIGTLGRGSFGHVQLVRDPKGNTYALKAVYKAQVIDQGQQEHIISEKKTMQQLNHPFLIRLVATFKDAQKLYFLQEVCLGGELFTLLRNRVNFAHRTARFYAAGVVSAFTYMHSKGIIYRDLKPENILLTANGYTKVTDFGFAKKIGRDSMAQTWTLCGTPDYLAPEVIGGEGHGRAVDWWTLGVLIYEMLAASPPFFDEDPMKTYAKIMNGAIQYPPHFKRASVDIIKKLLAQKSSKRLGMTKQGTKAIINHDWYSNFNWPEFEAERMPAPISVNVKDSEDLTNFQEDDDFGMEEDWANAHSTMYETDDNWDAEF